MRVVYLVAVQIWLSWLSVLLSSAGRRKECAATDALTFFAQMYRTTVEEGLTSEKPSTAEYAVSVKLDVKLDVDHTSLA
jgi:hypothetical protein